MGSQFLPTTPVAIGACSTHWNSIADPGATYGMDVAAVDVASAWYVGLGYPDSSAEGSVARYDGDGWTQVPIPRPTDSEVIEAVDATADDDVWVVGSFISADHTDLNAYLAHRDGTAFTRYPMNLGESDHLYAVDALAPDDVWAVGSHVVDGADRSLAIHWNGSAWTEVPTPSPPKVGSCRTSR